MTVLTVEQLRPLLKHNALVLWPNQDDVESGNVIGVYGDRVDICWLEGYKSRNDSVTIDQILSVHVSKGPEIELYPFDGKGYLTEAGVAWKAAHPRE